MTKKVSDGYAKKILALSDTHCGSYYFVFPDNFEGFKINEGQQRLLSYWHHMVKSAVGFGVDEVWFVGDGFAGINYKGRGEGLLTTNIDFQALAAENLLAELLDAFKDRPFLRVWSGTPYHESIDTRKHMDLARGLGGSYEGSWSFVTLYKKNGIKKEAYVSHEASNSMVYPETPVARDISFFKQGYADGKLPKINLIVRAHKHSWLELEKGVVKAVQLPCWGTFYPYQASIKNFPMWQTDIGCCFIMVKDDSRVKVQEWIYPPFIIKVEASREGVAGKIVETPYDPIKFVEGWQ